MKITSRTLTLTGLIAGICLFQSCEKIKDDIKTDIDQVKSSINVTINVSAPDITVEVPAAPAMPMIDLGEQSVYLNMDSIVKYYNNQLSAENIKSIKLASCHLEMSNGDSLNNFANLSACKVSIKSAIKTDPVTIAEVDSNPDVAAYSLDMPVNADVDLKDYFNNNSFTYSISASSRRETTKPLDIKATLKYKLKVGLASTTKE